jgi:hypothetical protein
MSDDNICDDYFGNIVLTGYTRIHGHMYGKLIGIGGFFGGGLCVVWGLVGLRGGGGLLDGLERGRLVSRRDVGL